MKQRHAVDRVWTKSSYSNGGTNCVEWTAVAGRVAFRDSKVSAGPVLLFPAEACAAFVAATA